MKAEGGRRTFPDSSFRLPRVPLAPRSQTLFGNARPRSSASRTLPDQDATPCPRTPFRAPSPTGREAELRKQAFPSRAWERGTSFVLRPSSFRGCPPPLASGNVGTRGRFTVARYSHVLESRDAAGRGARGLALGLILSSAGAPRAADPVSTPTAPTINEVGGKTLKEWIADLKHTDPSVREEAIRAIPLFGAAASEAVPALVEHVNDIDESPRAKAILTLGALKIADKDRAKVIDALGKRLEVESQGPIRYDLALALLGFGKDAKPALPGLLHCAADPSCFEVRRICLAGVVAAGQTDNGPDRAPRTPSSTPSSTSAPPRFVCRGSWAWPRWASPPTPHCWPTKWRWSAP